MKNITKSIRYMALAAAALPMSLSLLTSCSNDRDEELLVRNEVKFTTAISESVQSRADVAYTPADDSMLDVYYGSLGAIRKGTYAYSDKGWSATEPLYWDGLDASDERYTFYAVAPAEYEYGTVQADQSTVDVDNFTASDLLVARSTVTAKNTPVAFTLKHVLSQLVVNVQTTNDETALTEDELAATSVTIGGLKTAYTLTEGTTAEVPATAVAKDDPATGLKAHKDGNAHRFIAPAQELAADALTFTFTVTIGGSEATYLYKAPATTLAAGTITAFSITIKKTGVTLGGITLTDWSTGEEQQVEVNYASIQVGTIAGAAEGDELTLNLLNLLDKSPAVAATATYTYTKTSAEDAETPTYAWISEAPLYWNEIANDDTYSGTFTALYKAADGTWSTGRVDNVAHGEAPSFNSLTQAMAKMTITLVKGDGISDVNTEVTGRIVTLKKPTTTPAVNADGDPVITLGNAPENIGFDNEVAFVVAPQDITADNVITLTRANGNTYTLALNTLTEVFGETAPAIVAGTHYQLTLTVNETSVAITATIAEWTDVPGSGTVTPDFQ